MLIDTGNGGAAAARDADRIMAAVKDAGLTQIDHLITTHWHGDHFGGDGGAGAAAFRSATSSITGRTCSRGGRRRVPAEGLSGALRARREAHGREAGRHDAGRGPRLAHRERRRARSSRRRCRARARPNPYCADYKPQEVDPHRERAVGWQRRDLRPVPGRAPRRSDLEQGIRPDVPDEPHRHGRSLRRLAPRPAGLELAAGSSMRSSRAWRS